MRGYSRYLAIRVGQSAITLFAVVTFNFWLFHSLPGNYAQLVGRAGSLDPDALASLRESYGLDKSAWEQYVLYLKNLVTFDWGTSFVSQQDVATIVRDALLNTLILVGPAFIVMVIAGVALGVWAGSRRGTRTDASIVVSALGLWSLPTFWFGLILVLMFSKWFAGLPVAGMATYGATYSTIFDHVYDLGRHLILPVITVALVSIGQFVLIMRNSLVDVQDEDYMLTARAKGLRPRRILWRHGVANAMLPTYTLAALNLGILLSSTVQVETVFSWPGIGRLMYTSVNTRDYPVLEVTFLVIAVVVIVANLIADLTYGLIDPRIEHE